MFCKRQSIKDLLPPPVKAQHAEYSMILSASDSPALLTNELLDLSLKAIREAADVGLGEIAERNEQARRYANLWPGEHYRLLAGLVLALNPSVVVEIGTSTGLSALSMKQVLPEESLLATFDLMPWHKVKDTLLQGQDFADGRLVQHVCDLSVEAQAQNHFELLRRAELIFIDATHDGQLEEKLLKIFSTIEFQKPCFLLFDDIKVWTMLNMWRKIPYPKIDLTSFGHWSGTGLVQL